MDNETYTFEDRMYVNPTTSRDEQLRFVDNLRAIQAEDAARIARDTHNLGTDVTSNLGGLNGSEGIWSQQHVNPQVNSMVASLRATAQAQALNDVLSNMQNQAKERYNRAYRAAQRRATNPSNTNYTNPGVEEEDEGSGEKQPLQYDHSETTGENKDWMGNAVGAVLDANKKYYTEDVWKWPLKTYFPLGGAAYDVAWAIARSKGYNSVTDMVNSLNK